MASMTEAVQSGMAAAVAAKLDPNAQATSAMTSAIASEWVDGAVHSRLGSLRAVREELADAEAANANGTVIGGLQRLYENLSKAKQLV